MSKRTALVSIFFVVVAIVAARIPVAHAQVVISEVMWMGSDISTADEWVELVAVAVSTGGSIDLSGWRLTTLKGSGEEETVVEFAAGVGLGISETLLIANYSADHSRLAEEPDIVTSAVSLPNTKLLLRLYDAAGVLVDTVDDGSGKPFSGENPSGTGAKASMERVDLAAAGTDAGNWRSVTASVGFDDGAEIFGTPGIVQANTLSSMVEPEPKPVPASEPTMEPEPEPESDPAIEPEPEGAQGPSPEPEAKPKSLWEQPPIRITEVLANPRGRDDEEWIEIGNLSEAETGVSGSVVNIAGWELLTGTKKTGYVIPAKSEGGFMLAPGQHVSFRKSKTGLTLRNGGDTVRLLDGERLVDSLLYEKTAEDVSVGRDTGDPEHVRPFCLPTERQKNVVSTIDPQIAIESGKPTSHEKVTLNLEAYVTRGSLAGAECHWDFGDGTQHDKCNPPSHTFREPGLYTIRLTVETFCHEVVQRVQHASVIAKGVGEKGIATKQGEANKPDSPSAALAPQVQVTPPVVRQSSSSASSVVRSSLSLSSSSSSSSFGVMTRATVIVRYEEPRVRYKNVLPEREERASSGALPPSLRQIEAKLTLQEQSTYVPKSTRVEPVNGGTSAVGGVSAPSKTLFLELLALPLLFPALLWRRISL